MKKRMLAILMAAAMCGTMLTGCGGGDSGASTTPADSGDAAASGNTGSADGKTYKIGCTFDYLSDFMANVTDGVNGYADESNGAVQVTVQDAEYDVAKQLQQVENFISGGYDAVVIKPVDSDGCAPMYAACKEAGIPFVVVNTSVSCDYDTYIGSDHKLSGELQAEFIGEALGGKGKVAILQGELVNAAAVQRTEGNEEVLKNKYPDIEIVSEMEALWMRDEAMTKTENWLNSGLEIDAILANNDEMALGAAKVLKEAGITDVKVCGIDATVEALNALKSGDLAMTVFQNGYQQGYQGVKACVDIIEGNPVEKYIDVPYETVLPDQADKYLEIVGG